VISWPTIALGETCEIISGATPKSTVEEYWDGDILWATPKDLSVLNAKFIEETPRKLTSSGLKSCAAKILPENSVLFSSRAPIGLVAINTKPMATNQGFKSMVPKNGIIDASYLYWWLVTHRVFLESKGRGATFKEVSKAIVEKIQIPLPPLEEQKRIAGILDAADILRAKRREALARLDDLLQATFLDLFGDPVTNPKGWEVTKIGNHVKVLGGYAFKSADFREEGFPIIRISNLKGDSIDLTDCARVPAELLGKGSRFKLHPDDTLIAMSGATTGKLGCVPNNLDFDLYLNQRVGAFRVPEECLVHQQYLRSLLGSPFYQQHVWNLAGGAAQPNISGKQLESAIIPLPPLDLQQRFAEIVSSVEEQKAKMRKHLEQLDDLFASLQQRAFRGDL
jgi:type I restriction enzyme, S subunit